MSLLLDALKRAEQEKLARQGEAGAAAPAPTLRDPAPTAARPATSAGGLELQPMPGAPAANPNATLGTPPRADAHAAQAVFQAKAANNDGSKSRGMLFATIGAIAVVAIAAGAYVWYAVSALTPKPSSAFAMRPRPITAPVPPPAGSLSANPTAAEAALASAPAMAAIDSVNSAKSTPFASPNPGAASAPPPAPAATAPKLRPAEEAAANLLRDAAPSPAPEPPLRLDRSPEPQRRVPPEVAAGYDELRQGNLAAARRSYEAALAANPANLDAVLGLATVEARAGSRTSATIYYRRALDVDPRNATALAGLAALADAARPDAVESELRSDLARSPTSGALHFALGNVLAAQRRWSEAQAEYFEAHRLEPGSPEILFNLAVSLDHLGQGRVAAGFYTRALDAARGQYAPFDPAAVRRRLEELR